MNGRGFFSILFGIVVVILIVGLGAGVYNAGVQQGIVDAGRFPAGAAVPYAGYGYGGFHDGFGIFGLIIPIFFLFLIFGIFRAIFRGGRGGYGGWGHHGWSGYDRGTWQSDREKYIADLHQRLHEDAKPGDTPPAGGTSPGGGPA